MQPTDTSAADLTAYQRDGAVALRNIISLDWIERLRAGVAENLQHPGPYAKRYTPKNMPGWPSGV